MLFFKQDYEQCNSFSAYALLIFLLLLHVIYEEKKIFLQCIKRSSAKTEHYKIQYLA